MMAAHVDISAWTKKVRQVQKDVPAGLIQALDEAEEEVYDAMIRNLSGSVTGEMPVPQVSRELVASAFHRRVTPFVREVGTRAPHGVYVHYGTRSMTPRPYLAEAVSSRRQAIFNKMRAALKRAVEGGA